MTFRDLTAVILKKYNTLRYFDGKRYVEKVNDDQVLALRQCSGGDDQMPKVHSSNINTTTLHLCTCTVQKTRLSQTSSRSLKVRPAKYIQNPPPVHCRYAFLLQMRRRHLSHDNDTILLYIMSHFSINHYTQVGTLNFIIFYSPAIVIRVPRTHIILL